MGTDERFQSDQEPLARLVQQMGGLCEGQVGEAIDSIVRRDSSLAQQVIEADARIDGLELAIEKAAVHSLTSRRLEGPELRFALSAIKMASDLERIGDLAKNIAKRALVINRDEPLRVTAGLAGMGRRALLQVKDVLDAFSDQDADRAITVWRADEDIDELYNSLFRELLTYMMEDPRTIGLCTHMLFVAKNIERVGDHATNIAETLYYLVQGTYVRDERPKGDLTSLTSISFDKPAT
ncbi:MAG: phosphate signaling complex protein PhoU [Alphaproteobacteria bacterium]